eukprot:TRINITY_DN888_c1_g1_i1.p1 TRINITY_DN888_c1_g1~~TRINITY_DN888_c1_g1_i1.p1  ORF type:complete len:330 (+),score=91.99 TRINITY_DN888_c1_g1_i1:69-992(+)
MRALAAAAALLLARSCGAVVSGLAAMPHGDFAYDPSLVHNDTGAVKLHAACKDVGRWLSGVADAVVLSTPHGLELDNNFLVYLNSAESGSTTLGQDLHNASFPGYEVRMNVTTDEAVAGGLVDSLGGLAANVSGIKGFAGSMPLPISWGEIIPLSFVTDELRRKVVLLGQPLRRYNDSVAMVPELVKLGRRLWRVLDALPARFAFLVSSDLAHTHLRDGPYGYCSCAEPYDQAVGRWAATQNSSALLSDAAGMQRIGAMSCGFTGLVMLEGMLQEAREAGVKWESEMLANFHPTYYGMMAARWSRAK